MCPAGSQLEGDSKEIGNMVHSSGNTWMTWAYQKAWQGKKCGLSNDHLDQGLGNCAHSTNLANTWYGNKDVLGQLNSPIYRLSASAVVPWSCESMAVWECVCMAVWPCDCVTMWKCGRVTGWQCDCVEGWQWDCVTTWQCDCVEGWHLSVIHSFLLVGSTTIGLSIPLFMDFWIASSLGLLQKNKRQKPCYQHR